LNAKNLRTSAAESIANPELARLLHVPPDDLWLPSLRNAQLSGRAYRFRRLMMSPISTAC
jgi:hypothetical protein